MSVAAYATLAGLRTRIFGPGASPSANDPLLQDVCDEVNDFIEQFTERVIAPIPSFSSTVTATAGASTGLFASAGGISVGNRLLLGLVSGNHEVATVLAISPDLTQTAEWLAETEYALDEVVEPVTPNGHTYRCVTAGETGSTQPVFPTDGSAVIDGGCVWLDLGLTGATVTFRAPLTYAYTAAPTQRILVLDGARAIGRRLAYRPGLVAVARLEFADGTAPTSWRLDPANASPGRPYNGVRLTNGDAFPSGTDDVLLIGPGPCVLLPDAPAFGFPAMPDAIRTVAYNLCAGRWQMRQSGGAYEINPGTEQVQVGAFMLTALDYKTLTSFKARWAIS